MFLKNSRWCHAWAWHIYVTSGWNCTTHLSEDRLFSHLSRVVLLASVAVNCNDALLLEKVPTVAKEQHLSVASVRTAVKVQVRTYSKILILCDGRTSLQGISYMSSIAAFSVITVWFAVEKQIFHCHIARRIGIWWQSAIIYSTHNWLDGNIFHCHCATRVVWHNQAAWTYLCSVWWICATLPVHKMQSTFAILQHPEYFL